VRSGADRTAITLALLSLLTLALGLLGLEPAFGAAAIGVILLPLWFGWRGAGGARGVRLGLAACGLLYVGLLWTIFVLNPPQGAPLPSLWGGYPPATAVFVYLLWPLGGLPAVLYALRFKKDALDDKELADFLSRYSKRRAPDRHGA
jgi:hypothetical protein